MEIMDIIRATQSIADEYGYEAQSRQLIEEMAKLTQAINKDWRIYQKFGRTKDQSYFPEIDEAHSNLVDALADVYITWFEVAHLIGAFKVKNFDDSSTSETDEAITEKLGQQIERLQKKRLEEPKPPIITEMKSIKTADELLESNYNELTPEEQVRYARIAAIPPTVKEMFLNIEKSKRELIMQLEKQRDGILDYLNGFTVDADKIYQNEGGTV